MAGPGDLRVRVRVCGVCRTDLHVVEGDLETRRSPLVPGHEVVGTVDAIGAGVGGFAIGDRVGIAWVRSTCGTCEFCVEGKTNLCERARFTGWTDDGGYAEHAVVPAEWAYPIPEVFTDDEAAPLLRGDHRLPRARALGRATRRAVGLYGFGGSAHIVIRSRSLRGVRGVRLLDPRGAPARSPRDGASWVGGTTDSPVPLHGSILFGRGRLVSRTSSVMRVRRWLDSLLISLATIWVPTRARRQVGRSQRHREHARGRARAPARSSRDPAEAAHGAFPPRGREPRAPAPQGREDPRRGGPPSLSRFTPAASSPTAARPPLPIEIARRRWARAGGGSIPRLQGAVTSSTSSPAARGAAVRARRSTTAGVRRSAGPRTDR